MRINEYYVSKALETLRDMAFKGRSDGFHC